MNWTQVTPKLLRCGPWTVEQGSTGLWRLSKNGKPVNLWTVAGPLPYHPLQRCLAAAERRGF